MAPSAGWRLEKNGSNPMSKNKHNGRRLPQWVRKALDVALPLAVSVGLVVWMVHKVDFSKIRQALAEGCDWRWFLLLAAIVVASHVIRGIRWGIQLRAAGVPRIPVATESASIFGAYALNLVFSYLGEAWRCLYISRISKAKISTVVGTDLGDRASDAVVVLSLVGLTLFVAHPAMDRFLERYSVGRDISAALSSGALWGWVAGIIAILTCLAYGFRNTRFMREARVGFLRIWRGFAVLFHMKHIWEYVWLTLAIWTCYFLETYVCFQAFPFTRHLITDPGNAWGLVPGLVVFVFGSCSIAIPSSGGLGPWNLAVMFALTLYGVPQAEGAAYSLVVWGIESGILILLGVYTALYVTLQRKKGFGLPETS